MPDPIILSAQQARRIWIAAQRLDSRAPFGAGPAATQAAVEHLGYVQIDTINVIERAHHHILFTRIPDYRRADLVAAQSVDKSVFEYWTHALAYVPTRDLRFYLPDMRRHAEAPSQWFANADPKDLKRLAAQIRRDGPLSIRDIDDEPVEKSHPWASRKPSKQVLQLGFYNGVFTICQREGMVKSYELMDRHFAWDKRPRPATISQQLQHMLERALRAQGIVSPGSASFLIARKKEMKALIEQEAKRRRLRQVAIEGAEDVPYWVTPQTLDEAQAEPTLTHILSPFDPMVINRARTAAFFGYDHVFEAYLPKAKRRFGYFTLPVLHGDEIVAALDLKADRQAQKLLIQAWHWVGKGNPGSHKQAVEEELDRFSAFQLSNS